MNIKFIKRKKIIVIALVMAALLTMIMGVSFSQKIFAEPSQDLLVNRYMDGKTQVTSVVNIDNYFKASAKGKNATSKAASIYETIGYTELEASVGGKAYQEIDLSNVFAINVQESYIGTRAVSGQNIVFDMTKDEAYEMIEADVADENNVTNGYIKSKTAFVHSVDTNYTNKDGNPAFVVDVINTMTWLKPPAMRLADLYVVLVKGTTLSKAITEGSFSYKKVTNKGFAGSETVEVTEALTFASESGMFVNTQNLPNELGNQGNGIISVSHYDFAFYSKTRVMFASGQTINFKAAIGHHNVASASLYATLNDVNIAIMPAYASKCYSTKLMSFK